MNNVSTIEEAPADALTYDEEQERRQRNRERQKRRDAAPCPRGAPSIAVNLILPGAHVLRFFHHETPTRSVRPYGAAALQLHVVLGESEVMHPEGAKLVGEFKRNPMRVEYAPTDDRKVATYFGRWVHRSGETGPWSQPSPMRIAA